MQVYSAKEIIKLLSNILVCYWIKPTIKLKHNILAKMADNQ